MVKKERIKQRKQVGQTDNIEFTMFADVCYICVDAGEDNELLVCDNCDYKVAHLKCLDLNAIPREQWFCQMCEI